MPINRAPNKLYPGSHIATFCHDGNLYEHRIFPAEDDRVECLDIDQNIVLTFTANCQVLDKHKRELGRWHLRNSDEWHLRQDEELLYRGGADLLKSEVEVSKLYLSGEFK